ncbi:MAG: V-type ATPase subunit [Thermoplasmata archaeon]|jgi:V/A-type H+/Na+-transporting ATPase subunit C
MAASPYASALGRLKPEFPSFLPRETYPLLLATKDPNEFAKVLETTPYAADIARIRATHSDVSLVELAINRTFVRRNRHAFEATPFAGRSLVAAYLGRWDIQNIEMILTAKAEGRSVTETEDHLVSSRDIPAGLYAGAMNLDDFRILLGQTTVEATVTSLVKYGYGATILPFLEAFERTHNIFPILHALDKEYYRNVLAQARFFQGDEWVVRGLLQSEIDARNALLLLKGKDHELPLDDVLTRWLEGGTLTSSQAPDLYSARNVTDLAERLAPRFPSVAEGGGEYAAAGTLSGYEVALERERASSELKRLRTYPLSLSVIFAFLLRSELERSDLRRAVFGRLYGFSAERLTPLLVSPRL